MDTSAEIRAIRELQRRINARYLEDNKKLNKRLEILESIMQDKEAGKVEAPNDNVKLRVYKSFKSVRFDISGKNLLR
jgi:guanylate kinase